MQQHDDSAVLKEHTLLHLAHRSPQLRQWATSGDLRRGHTLHGFMIDADTFRKDGNAAAGENIQGLWLAIDLLGELWESRHDSRVVRTLLII